jgi:hypothetical protein
VSVLLADPGLLALVPAATFISGALLIMIPERSRSVLELWAVIDRRHFCLYRSWDRDGFGQVQRAVMRARERAAP